jgi:hypothetical protein
MNVNNFYSLWSATVEKEEITYFHPLNFKEDVLLPCWDFSSNYEYNSYNSEKMGNE